MPDYTAVHDECMYAGEARSTTWLKPKKQQETTAFKLAGLAGGTSAGWGGGGPPLVRAASFCCNKGIKKCLVKLFWARWSAWRC